MNNESRIMNNGIYKKYLFFADRSVSGCNGVPSNIGYDHVECYLSGSVHWNGMDWKGPSPYFFGTTPPNNKSDWHFVEAYFKLNSISGGTGQPDGIVQYWYDGSLIIDHSNVILRTGLHPNMKFNQFILAPYIGDGSPADQTFWIDNLSVATFRPGSQQCHKSDTNKDGCVSNTELFAFIDLWKVDSSNPTLKELIEAIGLWKRGGC